MGVVVFLLGFLLTASVAVAAVKENSYQGRIDQVSCGKQQSALDRCTVFVNSYVPGKRFSLLIPIKKSKESRINKDRVTEEAVRTKLKRGQQVVFTVKASDRVTDRGRVWGINVSSRRRHYGQAYHFKLENIEAGELLKIQSRRSFDCEAFQAPSSIGIFFNIYISGDLVNYDQFNYSINKGSLTYQAYWDKDDDDTWAEAEKLPELSDPLSRVEFNSPSYKPTKHTGYLQFPKYRSESLHGNVDLLLHLKSVSDDKLGFTAKVIMTNISDHSGGSFDLKCNFKAQN